MIPPLDPTSRRGRAAAERLTRTLAAIRLEIARRPAPKPATAEEAHR